MPKRRKLRKSKQNSENILLKHNELVIELQAWSGMYRLAM